MSVKYDTVAVPIPEGAMGGKNRWMAGRELGAEIRAMEPGRSLICDRRARSVLRLLYSMRAPDGQPMRNRFAVADLADHPGWCRVWRLRAESDGLPLPFTDNDEPL